MFGRVLHVEGNHRTSTSLCYLSNKDTFQYVTQLQYMYKKNTLYLIMLRTYSNVEEVRVRIKVTSKEEISSSLTIAVGKGSEYEYQGC